MMTGERVRFSYSGQDDGSESIYPKLSGEVGTLVRPLTPAEADLPDTGPMWRVSFGRNNEIDAFEDELEAVE